MFSFRKPGEDAIDRFLREQSALAFSHAHVGATREELPAGYHVDRVRVLLGSGEAAFEAGKGAFRRWEQFQTRWTRLFPEDTPIEPGRTVVVRAHALGLWSLNACRVIYVVDEDGPVARFGFAYGTLPGHIEAGEERFLIEWDRSDGRVWYDIVAFFRPRHWLARIGWLYGLWKVNRFRRDSEAALREAVQREMLGAS